MIAITPAWNPRCVPIKSAVCNNRNGNSGKRVQGDFGSVEIAVPCDRNGSFEPQILAVTVGKLTYSLSNPIHKNEHLIKGNSLETFRRVFCGVRALVLCVQVN